MMKWLLTMSFMAGIALCATTGCQPTVEKPLVLGPPDADIIDQAPPYITQAAEAAGGWQAWTKIQQLCCRSVVTFYNPDGSFYLTQQCHQMQPWLNSITIESLEPQGKFVCRLSEGQFTTVQSPGNSEVFCGEVSVSCCAQAVLETVTAPARFLDSRAVFTKSTDPVKIEGLWYYPIEKAPAAQHDADTQKVIFYQNTDTSAVDIVSFVADDKHPGYLPVIVRAYDYRQIQDRQVMLPGRLEIFRTDAWGQPGRRLVKIDFETWSVKQYGP
ncbi:MAG TPA: hypothetical protein VMW23_02930 [Sedimentisphaerales bacterium]|nr:hypothetical protein [Sedimentisphaerales bacterium]